MLNFSVRAGASRPEPELYRFTAPAPTILFGSRSATQYVTLFSLYRSYTEHRYEIETEERYLKRVPERG
jgi:hypothetical protein